MSSQTFFFALNMPAQVSPDLLRDLVSRICSATSCAADGKVELARLVPEAVARAASLGHCELRFQVQDGELDVAVHAGAQQVWQTSRPIA